MTGSPGPVAALSIDQRRRLEAQLLQRRAARAEEARLAPRSGDEPPPLSSAQQRLWFLAQLDPGDPTYNVHSALRVRGALDADRLRRALDLVCARHESLRTSFATVDGRPRQIIVAPGPAALSVVDLQALPETDRAAELERILVAEVRRPFDLATGPVMRALLVRLAPDEHALAMTLHHIVADEWSLRLLNAEIDAFYRDGPAAATVAPLPIQYADFALWQRRWMAGPAAAAQLAYWRERLADLPPVLELIPGRSRPAVQRLRGVRHRWRIAPAIADGLDRLARAERATPFMVSLAAFMVLLQRYSGRSDVVVGTPIAGRQRPETERLIGFFANTLVLRADAAGDPSFREFLGRVRASVLGGFANQDLPFEKVVEAVGHRRSRGHAPLFQVLFTHRQEIDPVLSGAGLELAPIEIDDGIAKSDLWLALFDGPDGRRAMLEADAALFDRAGAARLGGQLDRLLESIVARPDARLSTLEMIPPPERALLEAWSGASRARPVTGSLAGLFAAQAAARPQAMAAECGDRSLRYDELDRWSTRLAHRLRAAGVGPETVVGIAAGREPALLAGLLAIVKAGGAYLPLDAGLPAARLSFMLRDAGAGLVLATDATLAALAGLGVRTLRLAAGGEDLAEMPTAPVGDATGPGALAYVMYTSGSTGTPKGVAIEQRGVIRLVRETDYARFGLDERVLQLAPVAFDASTFEVWGALLNGGCLVQVATERPSLDEIGRVIAAGRVTTLWLTAGLFHQMVDHALASFAGVGQVLAGGDVLSVAHVRRFRSAHPSCRLINGYGPTEATTFSCTHAVEDDAALDPSVPIGRPIANTQAYVLDDEQRPVPLGAAGELCVGGAGLARGYVNNPELTASRFVPTALAPGGVVYRTGDRVRWREDGTLQFLGRLDRQVKLRGFRIEPAEIEAALQAHAAVRQAVVAAQRVARGDLRLTAYCVLDPAEPPPPPDALRRHLQDRLPGYMVPAGIVVVPALPLTAQGKVDVAALPEPGAAATEPSPGAAPRDELEGRLAAIWAEILGVERVGIHDDFFALGGHSLLAAELFARLDRVLAHPLPLATIFDSSTIAQLAEAIRRRAEPAPWPTAVAVQSGGSLPTLFAVPGIGGNVVGFAAFARRLGPDQPLVGLQARGLDAREAPLERIEDIAADHVARMREIQPEGPYHLFGACIGGVVAFEMARQLRRDGRAVALLALLDPAFRGVTPPSRDDAGPGRRRGRDLAAFLLGRARLYAGDLATLPLSQWAPYLFGKAAALRRVAGDRGLPADVRREIAQGRVIDAHRRALKAYRPQAYPGPVLVFRSADRDVDIGRVMTQLATLVGQGLEIEPVPGADSGAALHEPHVAMLVDRLRLRLQGRAAAR